MYLLAVLCSVLFLAADRITKFLVVKNFELYETKPAVNGIFDFTYIHNSGGAWGFLSGKTWILVLFTAAAVGVCIFALIKYGKKSLLLFWSLCLILSGGLGNMLDRILNGGKVVDFIRVQFINFPIFNIADCAVVIGAGLLILCFLLDFKKDTVSDNNDEQHDI